MPGTTSASAGRWAATSPRNPCARARWRSSPTPATSPPPSPPTCERPAGAPPPASPAARTSTSVSARPSSPMPSTTTTAPRWRRCMSSRAGTTRRHLQFKKPVVACVVGRWKAKLTRAVGHAGAMAGSGDGAEAKEEWFQKILGRRRKLYRGKSHRLQGRRGRYQHLADAGRADGGNEASTALSRISRPRATLS